MTSYLSNTNAQYILQIMFSFFKDKYQYDILKKIPETELRTLIQETMVRLFQTNKHIPIESLNRITLSELKETIKEKYVNVPDPLPIIKEKNIPDRPQQEEETSPEDFMDKVQRLELQRKTFQLPPIPTQQTPAPSAPPPATQQPTPPPAPPIPNQISTIYMPTPPKIGKEIYIHSYEREWIYENDRSSFVWSGTFPKMQDRLCRIGCWIGPKTILQKASSLFIHIQGATGEKQEVSLIPFYECQRFVIYKPPLDSLGYISLLGLPWKIALKSSDGHLLDLGKDADRYDKIEHSRIINHHTILYVSNPRNYQIENMVRIVTDKQIKIVAKVMNVNHISIEIDQPVSDPGYVLNFTEQFSILLELTSSEHKKMN